MLGYYIITNTISLRQPPKDLDIIKKFIDIVVIGDISIINGYICISSNREICIVGGVQDRNDTVCVSYGNNNSIKLKFSSGKEDVYHHGYGKDFISWILSYFGFDYNSMNEWCVIGDSFVYHINSNQVIALSMKESDIKVDSNAHLDQMNVYLKEISGVTFSIIYSLETKNMVLSFPYNNIKTKTIIENFMTALKLRVSE